MQVKVKKLHENAVIPKYAHDTDAGLDLTATSKTYDEHSNVVYGTGLAFEIPQGYMGLLFPRSSNSKKDLLLSNSVGVVDSGYRGEVFFKFKPSIYYDVNSGGKSFVDAPAHQLNNYDVGERIGQLIVMPYPKIELIEVDSLDSSERGNGGFGSTGA